MRNHYSLSDDERQVISQLREESSDNKTGFTNLTFNAIAFGSTVLGLVLAGMTQLPYAVFAGLPGIAILMVIGRIGIFKYSTANRNSGYELHLARLSYVYADRDADLFDLRQIRWEEALRAWRIVQAAVFQSVYRTPECDALGVRLARAGNKVGFSLGFLNGLRPSLFRLNKRATQQIEWYEAQESSSASERKTGVDDVAPEQGYPWFMIEVLSRRRLSEGVEGLPGADAPIEHGPRFVSSYHAGSYLKHTFSALTTLQLMLLAPIVFQTIDWSYGSDADLFKFLLGLVVFAGTLIVVLLRRFRIQRRREILEKELLSIHSCSIIWNSVVAAHFLALAQTDGSMRHYTQHLTHLSAELCGRLFDIHSWNEEAQLKLEKAVIHRVMAKKI